MVSYALIVMMPSAQAIELLESRIETLTGQHFSLQGLAVALPIGREQLQVSASIITAKALQDAFQDLTLECGKFYFSTNKLACHRGVVSFSHRWLQADQSPAEVEVSFDGHGSVSFDHLSLAGEPVQAAISWQPGQWQLKAYASSITLEQLPAEVRAWIPLEDWAFTGRVELSLDLAFGEHGLERIEVGLSSIDTLDFSDPKGAYAGEKLHLELSATLSRDPQGVRGTVRLKPRTGEVYFDPVFMAFTGAGDWQTQFDWQVASQQLSLSSLRVQQPDLVSLRGDIAFDFNQSSALDALVIEQAELYFPAAYESFLQPFLLNSALAELETQGRLSGQLEIDREGLQALSVKPNDLKLHDLQQRFSLSKLQGDLRWSRYGRASPGFLQFSEASLFGLPIEKTRAEFTVAANNLALDSALTLPLLDGELSLPFFRLQGLLEDERSWHTQAKLQGLSLEAMTDAMELPPLGGTLSADIPTVAYKSGAIKVDGDIKVQVFDGDVVIRQPQVQGLFSVAPVLDTQIDVHNLDLDTLSRRFSFGSIEGELDGTVSQLQLVSWIPVSFDASFETPTDYTGPRRISQKAINNLTKLGGGPGVLPSTFLRVFKRFGYDRLGLACRLHNGICDMRGVENAAQGYFIVKGAGLPQVDVIGHNQYVDWEELWTRVKAVSAAGAPVVE